MANEAIADIFLQIADLLDLEGVAFKPEAYRRAARTLQQLPEDVADLVRTGRIDQVQGIGEALAEKIREFVRTGEVPYLAKLRAQWPPGLLDLLKLEGLGPKTTRRFYLEFQVKGIDDLDRVLRDGRLRGVKGFGDRKIELLQQAVAKARAAPAGSEAEGRRPLPEAQSLADELLEAMRSSGAPVERLVFAGSLRRRKETVGDLDILATSSRPREVMTKFTHLPQVEEVKLSGDTKSTVVLTGGFQVDLRVVAAEAFGAALQYFTGSKDHNVRLRALANKKGLKINEYGLTRGDTLIPARSEEEVYAAVGVPWIPPEMREDQGEIDAAVAGTLPAGVRDQDLRGELHIHVPASVEADDVVAWVGASKERGFRYAGLVVRAEDLQAQKRSWQEVRDALPKEIEGVQVLLGIEESLSPPRSGPREGHAAPDFYALRPPDRPVKDVEILRSVLQERLSGAPWFLGHLELEALTASALAWSQVLRLVGARIPVELAVSHDQVATETARAREARDAGCGFVLSGRPRLPEELARIELSAGLARRAWIAPDRVVNAGFPPAWALPDASMTGRTELPPARRSTKAKRAASG